MIPSPFDIEGLRAVINSGDAQLWLPIKQTWGHIRDGRRQEIETTIATLRSLTQTCRTLRALALPRLWEHVHVFSVAELGRLREVLRASPEIAQHIRSFVFAWEIHDDCSSFPAKEGTKLDLAFKDRWRVWALLRQQYKRPVQWDAEHQQWAFTHDGVRYPAPGTCPSFEGTQSTKQDWLSASTERVGGHGPDGEGEDRVVKNADDFNSTAIEIVTQLSSLETFKWSCNVASLPAPACEALKQCTLTSLTYGYIERGRESIHACEWWHHDGVCFY